MVRVRIAETSDISLYEKNKMKKEEDSLLIGRLDKTFNLVTGGEKISIKELPIPNRTGNTIGSFSMPMSDGIPYVFQYGSIAVAANSTVPITFPVAFANRCFQVQLSLGDPTDGASTLKSTNRTTTGFEIKRVGGTVNDIVQWFAIGF